MAAFKLLLALVVLFAGFQAGTVLAQPKGHEEHAPARPEAARIGKASWTTLPLVRAVGRRGDKGAIPFVVSGFQPGTVEVFGPQAPAKGRPLEGDQGRWVVSPDKEGGAHWIEAVQREPERIVRAATVWFFPGMGESPEEILRRRGEGLEIRPLRIPERGGYRESSYWDFRLLFDGQPVVNQEVELLTENGSRRLFKSDAQGNVRVEFPRDFSPESIDPERGAAQTLRGYLLAVNLQRDAVHHQTSFGYFYTPDLMRERSLVWGIGFMGLGMLLAVPFFRRRQGDSHA